MRSFFGVFIIFVLFGCNKVPAPARNLCFSGVDGTSENANEVRKYIIEFVKENDLVVYDHSEGFRDIEMKENIVLLDIFSGYLSREINMRFWLNSRGGSGLTFHSFDSALPEKISILLKKLSDRFRMKTFLPNDQGSCPKA